MTTLWMDVFEYPNQPNQPPKPMLHGKKQTQHVSNAGKRLCTVAEWELGCGGSWDGLFHMATHLLMTCVMSDILLVLSLEHILDVNLHLECKTWSVLYGSGQRTTSMPMYSKNTYR